MFVVFCLIAVFFLESVRRERENLIVRQHQDRLFALRDLLREQAMKEPAIARNWVFQYLDSTIARSISLLPNLSIWHALALMIAHRNDTGLKHLVKQLNHEYEKPHNEIFRHVEVALVDILGEYLVSRHFLMVIISTVAVWGPVKVARYLRQLKRRSLELVVESPETSTLSEFAPA
jgi:hypothetical protein